jgi:hypothetical protein
VCHLKEKAAKKLLPKVRATRRKRPPAPQVQDGRQTTNPFEWRTYVQPFAVNYDADRKNALNTEKYTRQ